MKKTTLILPLLLLTAGTVPAVAERPVSSWELNRFIGSNLHGKAYSNLGIVAAASRRSGNIALVGRHGELATIHQSLLVRDGMRLRAPALSFADVAAASNSGRSRVPLTRPRIIIEEFPFE